ncbi:MAG TPA: hypothetical protein PLV08_04865 [Flavobacteriales bacterium]|jgi:hypothetical protein|nr:hypothetical protein [Flavobacteriales bacterium]MBK7482815.1 hypothetical protein [Flavobacteriales bacterium]MBK7619421.1 hypothetical protein [Flavobacteriales bacterium]MBK8709741.1 hypothetical protein [Flavobacteriales bacterium]MBK9626374.1 hypothetical protein [Flavobacteriales bacterium]
MFFRSFHFRYTVVLIIIRIALVVLAFFIIVRPCLTGSFDGPPSYAHTDRDPGFEPMQVVAYQGDRILVS